MKRNNNIILVGLGITLTILGFFLLGLVIYSAIILDTSGESYEEKIVDCFDNYGNKIIGLECLEKSLKPRADLLFILLITLATIIIGGTYLLDGRII